MRYLLLLLPFLFCSCEEVVTLQSPISNRFFVVDGTITNQPGSQKIVLSQSQDFFDNSVVPPISNAQVQVRDNDGKLYTFNEMSSSPGTYVWTPINANEVMGKVGNTYVLNVVSSKQTYSASAKLNPVPPIDSILYQVATANPRQSGDNKPKEGFEAQFFARDLRGEGNTYRIKSFKNGKMFNGTSNLLLAYDAAQNKSAGTDGLMFILPIRTAISPELFVAGDRIKVELSSISLEQFSFFSQARLELNNAGLFARPAANIPTNIQALSSTAAQGAGWFGASAISEMETVVDPAKARKNLR